MGLQVVADYGESRASEKRGIRKEIVDLMLCLNVLAGILQRTGPLTEEERKLIESQMSKLGVEES
jgi:hypothetical protein